MPGPAGELELEGVSITGGKEEAELSMDWVNLQVVLDCIGLRQSFPQFSGLALVMGFSWQLAKKRSFLFVIYF